MLRRPSCRESELSSQTETPTRCRNPFATCWTRPGALPFAPTDQATVEQCLVKLQANSWRGQIVGPHGVGKSTLLRALQQASANQGLRTHYWRAAGVSRPVIPPGTQVLFLDSYESLPRFSRWCQRRRRIGLVVTTHRPAGLPTLAVLRPTLEDAAGLFHRLTANISTPVELEDLRRSFGAHAGNLREVWFDLYDLHERRTRTNRPGVA